MQPNKYIRLDITETERSSPNTDSYYRYKFDERFHNVEELKEYLIDKYGAVPGGRRKIYMDDTDGNSHVVGFLHSYWRDSAYPGDNMRFQTDWISITDVTETARGVGV